MVVDGRAGYQDYIHNLDKLAVYIDSSSQRGNYYTRRSYVAGAGSSRRLVSGGGSSKRAVGGSSVGVDRRRDQHQQHVDATLCGVRTRAAVATAAGLAQPDVRNHDIYQH